MVQVIFTLDYEIYGNGCGSLRELVVEPTLRLAEIFARYEAPLVIFAEALEFAKIEEARSDPAIGEVRRQLRELRAAGHEIGLHLHPWWANARYEEGKWHLDYSERNICAMPLTRISTIVAEAIAYLRRALDDWSYVPRAFRGGLWLMQPTEAMARSLAQHGIHVDSSVFKGGRMRGVRLDYRPALQNGWFWRFASDVNYPDASGALVEIPIHTEMVPFWRMLGGKRLRIQRKVPAAAHGSPLPRHWSDFLRLRYPRKCDFCRMTLRELTRMVEAVLRQDRATPEELKPLVAIGHSKDLIDFQTIAAFLDWLRAKAVSTVTLDDSWQTARDINLARDGQ